MLNLVHCTFGSSGIAAPAVVSVSGGDISRYDDEFKNADVMNKLNRELKDIHYFVYRTGCVADGTEKKIRNTYKIGQALMSEICPKISNIL